MQYTNNIRFNQLFRNAKLARVVPQFPKNQPLQNIYSFSEITSRIRKYLLAVLGGRNENGTILVKGNHAKILPQVEQLKPLLVQFFEQMPALVKNLRRDTRIYIQYGTATQIENIRTKQYTKQKIDLMQDILDNLQYNPDLQSINRILQLSENEFKR